MLEKLESLEKLNANWGYSREVGSWNMELMGANSDEPETRFQNLIDTLKKIIPPIKKLHTLDEADFDLAILGEAITEKGKIEEKEFLEFAELEASSLDEVISAFEKLSFSYPRFIITRISMDLNTKIKTKNQEFICPNSAELYISTDGDAIVGQKDLIYVSYSTYIDIWLKKTFENKVPKDNTEASKLNYPRLRDFLLTLEENLGGSFKKGESYNYSDYLQRIGFKQ